MSDSKRYEPVFFDIETTGFNPMAQQWWDSADYGARVTAIGIGTLDNWRTNSDIEDAEIDMTVLTDSSEYRLLEVARDRVESIIDDVEQDGVEAFMAGHNSRKFDHPYLGARYARLRMHPGPFGAARKRLDTMRALGKHFGEVGRYPKEDDVLEELGIESDDPYDGSDMPDAFGNGEWDKIQTHVEHDVREMMELWLKVKDYCMLEFYDHYDIEKDPSFPDEVDY